MENYLTPEGLEKLKNELSRLENVERKALADKLSYAISFGDLKENAAYHQAKEQQGFVEGRISELKSIIGNARVVDRRGGDNVQIGSRVKLMLNGTSEEFQLVGPDEADIFCGKISYESPLGKVLIGKIKGCRVKFQAPGGMIEYEIVEIS